MNPATLTAELPWARRRLSPSPRLLNAELLKLRKRRGLVLSTLLLTVAPMMVAYTVLAVLHAANPAHHGPAGGMDNFTGNATPPNPGQCGASKKPRALHCDRLPPVAPAWLHKPPSKVEPLALEQVANDLLGRRSGRTPSDALLHHATGRERTNQHMPPEQGP